MLPSLDALVDNSNNTLEDVYKTVVPECEEIRIATGYFYLSGFDLFKEDLDNLRDPEELEQAPFRILMGRKTDQRTVDEVSEGQTLREQFQQEVKKDVEELNNAQIERLDRLRDFIAEGLVDVRVRNPIRDIFMRKAPASAVRRTTQVYVTVTAISEVRSLSSDHRTSHSQATVITSNST